MPHSFSSSPASKLLGLCAKKELGNCVCGRAKKRRNVVVLKLKDWKLRPILSPPPLPWRSNYKSEKVVGGGFSSFLWTCVSDAFSRRRTQLFERRPIEREGGASSKLSQSDERTEEGGKLLKKMKRRRERRVSLKNFLL